jgi:phage gpG-like protein
MSRDLVTVDIKIPDWLAMLQQHLPRVQIAIASDIQFNIAQRFDRQGQYHGHERWKDLKSGLNLKKAGNGLAARQVLKGKSGALKNSIGPDNADGTAGPNGYVEFSGGLKDMTTKVGTRVAYARIHNEGGEINWPGTNNGFGRGIKIKAHKIGIPKRNFTDWNSADKRNLTITIKNTIEEILNGR